MHSFVSCLMHCVFATRERRPVIELKKHGMEYVERDLE